MTVRRKRRKLVSEINVVPYIDVMLVLLILFMVTTPLLNVGVDIELPKANAKPVDKQQDQLIVTINATGQLFLKEGAKNEPIDEATLQKRVGALVGANKELPVFIGADQSVGYGRVYQVMALLQQANVPRIGLMGEPAGNTATAVPVTPPTPAPAARPR